MSKYLSTILAGIVMCASAAWADTVELPLTDDAFVNGIKPDVTTGTWASIVVHNYGPKYGLVRFDAASIAGQEVSEATLTLYLNSLAVNGTMSVHAITSGWTEATVTWNNQPPAEATATATVELTTGDVGGVIEIDVTAAVQRWADGSLADAGFLMVTSEDIRAKFDAKEMAGGVPATLTVETGEPPDTGEAIVLDLSDPDNCPIDEPGYYVLDRSWLLSYDYPELPNAECGIRIIADGPVTIDLRGFTILAGDEWPGPEGVVTIDTLHSVTLRNGELLSNEAAIDTNVGPSSGRIILDGIHAIGTVRLSNRPVTITGGRFASWTWLGAPDVGPDSRVQGAEISCSGTEGCFGAGEASLISNCTIESNSVDGPTLYIGGSTILEGNTFEGDSSQIWINGNGNVVARNVSQSGGDEISVRGTGNVIESNVGPAITFQESGNFFGNNRVKLPGGFSGTEGNVDWGGNVTF